MARLPHQTKVDVPKCHACHVKRRWMSPSATPATQSAAASRATNGDTSAPPDPAQCQKRHACHTKRRWMSPSAMPATQSAAASRATNGDQARHQTQPSARSATPATPNEGGCRQVPCLPRKVPRRHGRLTATKRSTMLAQCQKRHACHAKRRWMLPSATLATPNEGGCRQAPRLPRETKVDVAKFHGCHAKCRGV